MLLRDVCVWVDPIDGSTSFREDRLENVTNIIGVTIKGRPKFGVITKPFFEENLGRVYIGNLESGLFQYDTNYTDESTSQPMYVKPFSWRPESKILTLTNKSSIFNIIEPELNHFNH